MSNNNSVEPDTIIGLIQDAQLEFNLKESEKKKITLGKNTYNRKPVSNKQVRELYKINNEMAKAENDLDRFDKLSELREKAAEYYFGIDPKTFDEYYEKLVPTLTGCIMRTTTDLSPEIDFNKIREKVNKLSNSQPTENKI